MTTKTIVPVLLIGFSSSVFAAKSVPSSASLTSAMEVLNLPGENRRMAVEKSGTRYYDSFIQLAFSDKQSMNVRWKALMGAAEAQGEKATKDLLKAGDHSQWFMRNAALVALSEVNPTEADKLAQKLLKDKALVVRSAAVGVLEKSLTEASRDLLWEELDAKYNFKDNQSLWIRHQIVEALAKKPKDHELRTFAKLLTDKDPRVQLPAISGLERLTGVKLGEAHIRQSELVGMWQSYVKREHL